MKKQYKNSISSIISILVLFVSVSCNSAENKRDVILTSESINSSGSIKNSGFEDNDIETNAPKGWSIIGTKNVANVVKGGFSGKYELYYQSSSSYEVTTEQVMSNLKNGIYDLEFNYKNGGGQKVCYVSAGNSVNTKITSLQVSPNSWTKSIVKGINVTNGQCTIKIYSKGTANWTRYDDFKLIKVDKEYTLLKGGDVSQLSYIEQMGGKFYEDGKEKDCFDILEKNGFNIVRLRLYNDPGNPKFSPSNRLPAGIQNPTDILRLAKRAADHNMQIQLTFYYSDYWSSDLKTHAWEGISFAALKDSVYKFTYNFMNKMKAQGTIPQYVSLGNESNEGILFPEGKVTNSWSNYGELINLGYKAVKDVAPTSKVIIHLSDAGGKETYDWFFGNCLKHNIKYDIIGTSYYPFWTKRTITQLREWADYVSAKYDKDIILMESGYNWNPTKPDGWPGQLSNNGPYDGIYPSSPQGQKDFLLELHSEIKKVKNGRIIGNLYWDPIMIAVPGVGWELGAPNVVSNTTLFDFSGNALPVLDAFKYNN